VIESWLPVDGPVGGLVTALLPAAGRLNDNAYATASSGGRASRRTWLRRHAAGGTWSSSTWSGCTKAT